MSSITGSCGPSQSELLIQQGLQHAQARYQQERRDLEQQALAGPAGANANGASEPNKGINLDVYA